MVLICTASEGARMSISTIPRRFAVCSMAGLMGIALIVGAGHARADGARPRWLWLSSYDGPGKGLDNASAVAVSPDGSSVFVTGYSDGGFVRRTDYATASYDAATGDARWVARYGALRDDSAYALDVSPDGGAVYVTGSSYEAGSGDDYATVAYDAGAGKALWAARYTSPGDGSDAALALGVSPDGSKVFVTGRSWRPTSAKQQYATVAYDASSGRQLWSARYGGATQTDQANALAVSPDGSLVAVTGVSGYDIATVVYDAATGLELWAKRENPLHDSDAGWAIGMSPDGSTVFVTGYGGPDYATIAYDAATGNRRWTARFNGSHNQSDAATALAVSRDGSVVFVTGSSYQLENGFDSDYATLAYDAGTGHLLWDARFTGPGANDDVPWAMGVTPDGSRVVVAGWTTDPGGAYNYDYGTVVYEAATGATLGVARVDSGFDDLGYDMTVSPDGSKVFVTGRIGSGGDYGTVAYSSLLARLDSNQD
jgi:WD40 repeat protein